MTWERAIGLCAVALAAGMLVVWLGHPRERVIRRTIMLSAQPSAEAVTRALGNVRPLSRSTPVLADGRQWDCSYWDNTLSKKAPINQASLIMQWCTPTRGG